MQLRDKHYMMRLLHLVGKKRHRWVSILMAAMYSKDQTFEDVPIIVNPNCQWQPCISMYQNGPRIHEFHKEMNEKTFSRYDVFTVGEIGSAGVEESLKYVSLKANELNMMFLFDMLGIGIGRPPISKDLVRFKRVIKRTFVDGRERSKIGLRSI